MSLIRTDSEGVRTKGQSQRVMTNERQTTSKSLQTVTLGDMQNRSIKMYLILTQQNKATHSRLQMHSLSRHHPDSDNNTKLHAQILQRMYRIIN
jgi:hypothetical protein